jgi:hypothetical protein
MPSKAVVTMRAILQRLNRRLAHDNQVLKAARGRYDSALGPYYAVSLQTNTITAQHVDPVAWAQEFGLLQPWETVESQDAPAPEPEPSVPDAPPFDPHKFYLGTLCKHGHPYRDTTQSLRRLVGGICVACARENQRKQP